MLRECRIRTNLTKILQASEVCVLRCPLKMVRGRLNMLTMGLLQSIHSVLSNDGSFLVVSSSLILASGQLVRDPTLQNSSCSTHAKLSRVLTSPLTAPDPVVYGLYVGVGTSGSYAPLADKREQYDHLMNILFYGLQTMLR